LSLRLLRSYGAECLDLMEKQRFSVALDCPFGAGKPRGQAKVCPKFKCAHVRPRLCSWPMLSLMDAPIVRETFRPEWLEILSASCCRCALGEDERRPRKRGSRTQRATTKLERTRRGKFFTCCLLALCEFELPESS